MTSHRIKDRRKPDRRGVWVRGFEVAVKFQNNSSGCCRGGMNCARADVLLRRLEDQAEIRCRVIR
jgi:hypothetical protein